MFLRIIARNWLNWTIIATLFLLSLILPGRSLRPELRNHHGERADAEYVRILYMAASSGEAPVERALLALLESATRFDAEKVRHAVTPERPSVPTVAIGAPDLRVYDALLQEAVS